MGQSTSQDVLHIKKYPNRRYYDTTRSRHITMGEVHDLICEGRDVVVTDSKSGADITNVLLLQILLEKDHPKLDIFPSSILHMMVRTDQSALKATMESFFGPMFKMMSQSQRQFDTYLRQAMNTGMPNPMNWAAAMMNAFSPNQDNHQEDEEAEATPAPQQETISELQEQVAELNKRLENLQKPNS
ncbi:MAG: polyhydroxyalkanoate synthesis regulator DNA-binding domain-containing protein [Planctomycetota bacterium]|jgi:polyhydroxyalkanoate synthesis repressor PhaR